MKKSQGFTLIELMIVIAIIGVLASIAVPQYGDYVRKAKITEALALSHEAKNALITYHAINNAFVPNYGDLSQRNLEIGLQERSAYASSNVELLWVGSQGVRGKPDTSAHIAILLPDDLGLQDDGAVAHLLSTIEFVDGKYIFVCNNREAVWPSTIKAEYLPKGCQ